MNKIKFFAVSGLALSLLVLISIYGFKNIQSAKDLKIIHGIVDYARYETVDEMADKAQLVVIESSPQKIEERKPVTKSMPNGSMYDQYTLTNIKVKKVLKQPANFKLDEKNEMTIIEPVVLLNDKNGKRLLTGEDYSPLVENDDYILYLAANDNGTYCIINMYRGKFNLSKDENVYKPLVQYTENHKSKYMDMKKQVANKYSLVIKENK